MYDSLQIPYNAVNLYAGRLRMNLKNLQKHWELFGRTDPFWAILTSDEKKNGRWNSDEFFQTGRDEIRLLMERLKSHGVEFHGGRALDFGCGAGRLSQALADIFPEVCGVDISTSMIELAQKFNKRPDRCKYILNEQNNLGLFADGYFDFIYSSITLQHMEPSYALSYIAEFVRVCSPEGIIVFQLPAERLNRRQGTNGPQPVSLRSRIIDAAPSMLKGIYYIAKIALFKKPTMEVYTTPKETVMARLNGLGVDIVAAERDYSAGPQIPGYLYILRKRTTAG